MQEFVEKNVYIGIKKTASVQNTCRLLYVVRIGSRLLNLCAESIECTAVTDDNELTVYNVFGCLLAFCYTVNSYVNFRNERDRAFDLLVVHFAPRQRCLAVNQNGRISGERVFI